MSTSVPRFGHGSRVPGWDEAADLSKPPAEVPDPATTPVPPALRAEIEAAMAKYPDRRSAAIPALHAAQEVHGWCSPEAIEQVAAVMQVTPAYLSSVATFYDMFSTVPKPPQRRLRLHEHLVLAARRRRVLRGDDGSGRRRTRTSACARSSASGRATSHRWRRSTASTWARSSPRTRTGSSRTCAPGAPVLEHKQLRYRRCADPEVAPGADDFSPPDRAETPMSDTAGLPEGGEQLDRPGPTAPIGIRPDEEAEK